MKTMKFRIMIIVAVVAFLAPAISVAQATVNNTTSKVVTLKAVDGSAEVTVNPHKRANVSFASSGSFSFNLFVYEGMTERSVGRVSKTVNKGSFEISNGDLYGIKSTASKQQDTPPVSKLTYPDASSAKIGGPTTTIFLYNSSDFTIECLDSKFAGVTLKPGQTSEVAHIIPTGQIEITFKHDVEKDSVAHGRKYRQSVYSGMISQGQENLEIKNENLTEMGGEAIKTFAKSLIPFKFVFTAGPWKGQALRYEDFTKKASLNEGFNSLAIQFVGPQGLKYQADIEVIVTKKDKPLIFREADIKNLRVIKQ